MHGSAKRSGARARALATTVVACLLAGLISAVPAAACATGHLAVRWSGFPPELGRFGGNDFYYVSEATTTASLTIRAFGDDCGQLRQPVSATYEVADPPSGAPRSASSVGPPPDYQPARGTTPPLWDHSGGQQEETIQVPILQDVLLEPVAERVRARITASTGRIEVPWDVPLYIVDDEAPERAAFERSEPYERSETYGSILVPLFRAGPALTEASYSFAAEGSSQNPATEGQDYRLPAGPISFAAGERLKVIAIELFDDGKPEPPEELSLTLTDPGPVLPDDPVTTTVRILDSVGASGLQSRLHHPRQGKTYRSSDYRIREVHVFTSAGQGAPIVEAGFALRRNLKGGRCAWWTGKRFRRGECQNERWLSTRQYEPDFFYYRLPEMRPSVGRIKSYTAYSRAINGTSEIESFLEKGRNANTFKVKKPRK